MRRPDWGARVCPSGVRRTLVSEEVFNWKLTTANQNNWWSEFPNNLANWHACLLLLISESKQRHTCDGMKQSTYVPREHSTCASVINSCPSLRPSSRAMAGIAGKPPSSTISWLMVRHKSGTPSCICSPFRCVCVLCPAKHFACAQAIKHERNGQAHTHTHI